MADLREGTVLGGRFEVVGVLGRGGTATVHLARDRVRDERVALKVLHPHLAHDPSMRDRLRREVQAAGVLRHEAALVAWELHDVDGLLALSLPFHPGQTLAERVATGGSLPVEDVRALGIRLAGALAEAHRKGLLHRDVTPNNVLVGGQGAVLTDFGLSRIAEPGGTRSTGVLGTAGYAAPEVYSGVRRDPRSDLYGLGAVLYLAATGKAPFEAPTPMAALQRQLTEDQTPLAEARPDLPPELAGLIERLLRRDPEHRPQGAREVLDALELRALPPDDAARMRLPAPKQHLRPGDWSVLVKERPEDFGRRYELRQARYRRLPAAERQLRRWAQPLLDGLKHTLGIEDEQPPEEQLVSEVARAAGLPPEALALAPELLESRFRLVDGVDRPTAQRLCRRANELGLDATVVERPSPAEASGPWQNVWPALIAGLWTSVAMLWAFGLPAEGAAFLAIVASVVIPSLGGRKGSGRTLRKSPVAYLADLSGHLADGWDHLALPRDGAPAPEPPPPESHGRRLAWRALANLDALERAVAERADLPDLAIRDLRATVADLKRTADALATDVDRLEAALTDQPGTNADWLQARISRLETMQRAGEPVDASEIGRLRAALEAHRADSAAADALESQLTACQAQLLEIASAASRIRRELVAAPAEAHSADRLVTRLQQETRAADEARREAGRRHAAHVAQRQG